MDDGRGRDDVEGVDLGLHGSEGGEQPAAFLDVAEQVVFVVTGLFREMADASTPSGSAPARTP